MAKEDSFLRTKEYLKRGLLYSFLFILLVCTLFPFYWMFITSIKPEAEILKSPPKLLLFTPTLKHYLEVFREANFMKYFFNSVVISISITVVNVLTSCLGGYAFAKFKFPGREKVFALLLATLMVPGQLTLIPVFAIIKKLHLLNTFLALILPAGTSVFGIFLTRQFMLSVPDELIEAARIDGCGEFMIFFRIIMPITKPVIATLGIFTFMGAWNDFIMPLVMMIDDSMYTLPVALASLSAGAHNTNWGILMAGSLIIIVPVVILFLFAQKTYMSAISTSGLKE